MTLRQIGLDKNEDILNLGLRSLHIKKQYFQKQSCQIVCVVTRNAL